MTNQAVSYLDEAVSCMDLREGQHTVLLDNVGVHLTPFGLESPLFHGEKDVLHRELDGRAESVVRVDRSVDDQEAVSPDPFIVTRCCPLLLFLRPTIGQLSSVLDFHRIGTIIEKHQDPLFPDKEIREFACEKPIPLSVDRL